MPRGTSVPPSCLPSPPRPPAFLSSPFPPFAYPLDRTDRESSTSAALDPSYCWCRGRRPHTLVPSLWPLVQDLGKGAASLPSPIYPTRICHPDPVCSQRSADQQPSPLPRPKLGSEERAASQAGAPRTWARFLSVGEGRVRQNFLWWINEGARLGNLPLSLGPSVAFSSHLGGFSCTGSGAPFVTGPRTFSVVVLGPLAANAIS